MKRMHLTSLAVVACALAAVSNAQDNMRTDVVRDHEQIVLINPFVVAPDKLDETIAMWEMARDFLQQQPGYISTALHQSIAPSAQYRLINVAKWESVEAFKAATQKMQAEANLPRIEGTEAAPQLYTVVRRD